MKVVDQSPGAAGEHQRAALNAKSAAVTKYNSPQKAKSRQTVSPNTQLMGASEPNFISGKKFSSTIIHKKNTPLVRKTLLESGGNTGNLDGN